MVNNDDLRINSLIKERDKLKAGYGVAVKALRDIVKHLETIIPKSTLLLPVGIIASRTLDQLGELDEQEDKR